MTEERSTLGALADAIEKVSKLQPFTHFLPTFIGRVSRLFRGEEEKAIEVMEKYLRVVNKELIHLSKNGFSDKEIRKLAEELKIPILQANCDALRLSRYLNRNDPH